jgi:Zn-dependent peptidase ImmA (M78 family)
VSDDHHITIDGKRWLLRFTRLKGNAAGWTFFDNATSPRILIDDRLKGGSKLETILHELAHAVLGPTISEETVTELARVQRRVLKMLHYREVPREQSNG